jgi:hypothetical protein
MTTLQLGAVTWQSDCDPVRPGGHRARLFQPQGRYSDGRRVVHDKSVIERHAHRVRFERLGDGALAALRSFHRDIAQGMRYRFSWTDHSGAVRSVRFAEAGISSEPNGPGRNRVEIVLEEDL